MPERLSVVGKRHALARAAANTRDAGMGTPAEMILNGQSASARTASIINDIKPVIHPLAMPPSLPEPADTVEHGQLVHILRAAQHALKHDEGLLTELHKATERNRDEIYNKREAVERAERQLREVRQYGRQRLVESYINGTTDGMISEADVVSALALCQQNLARAEEIRSALQAEIASIENGLEGRRRDIAHAAGALVSRTALIGLVERIYRAYRELRDVRLVIREIGRLADLDDNLVRLADSSWPSTGHRFGGYLTDEKLVADWTNAIIGLLTNADAPLPGSDNGTNSSKTNDPVRGGARSTPRNRAQGATPLRRPARRTRAGGTTAGLPARRRASLARERDASGKWLPKDTEKAAEPQPDPPLK